MLTILGVVVLSFLPAAEHLLGRWMRDPTYGHGLLLTPLTVYLVFKQLRDVEALSLSRRALVLTLALAAAMSLGQLLGLVAIFQALVPLLVLAMLVAVYGDKALKRLAAPVLMLYFSLPVWDVINPALQSLTSAAVGRLIYASGLAAFIEGNRVSVAEGVFEIAAGCSGLRFFIISAAVSALYGYWYLARAADVFRLVALSMVVAIIGNWIRVFVVIQMGVRLGIDHPQVVDHTFMGWLVFILTMLVVFWFAGRMAQRDSSQARHAEIAPAPSPGRVLVVTSACVMVAASAFGARAAIIAMSEAPDFRVAERATSRVDACGLWQSNYQRPTSERRGAIRWQGEGLCVDVVWYSHQRQGAELINPENEPFIRKRASGERVEKRINNRGDSIFVVRYPSGEGVWIGVRNKIGSQSATSSLQAKILQLQNLLSGRLDAHMIAVAQRCDADCRAAFAEGSTAPDVSDALDVAEQTLAKEWETS